MASQYIRYPSSSGTIPTYATFTDLPAFANDGSAAITLDTDTLYIYNTGTTTWYPVAKPGDALAIGTYDSGSPSANGIHLDVNNLIAQSASNAVPGMVNISTQTFAGNKTFTGTITASNLSGSNTGDVTIGTANGLSLSSQILSLALSSTSTTGALSSTDWNTFNNKQASGNYITALTGDVTATGPGSVASTVAKIQSTVVSGTTGSTNVVFSASPTLSGTVGGAVTFSGAIAFSTSATSPIFSTSTATPATAGIVRLANADNIGWRNASNSANYTLGLDSSNLLNFATTGTSVLAVTSSLAGVPSLAIQFQDTNAGNTAKNWLVGANIITNGNFDFVPSTAAAGTTFSTSVFTLSSAGNATLTGAYSAGNGSSASCAYRFGAVANAGMYGQIFSGSTLGPIITANGVDMMIFSQNSGNGSPFIYTSCGIWGFDGANTQPAFTFFNQSNLGLYRSASGEMSVTAGGTQSVKFAKNITTFLGRGIFTGQADAVQLTVTGNATQTSNILTVQTSGSTALMTINNSAQIGLGAAWAGLFSSSESVNAIQSISADAGTATCSFASMTTRTGTTNQTNNMRGARFSANRDLTAGSATGDGGGFYGATSNITVTNGANNWTNAGPTAGFQIHEIVTTGAGNITTTYAGLRIEADTQAITGTMTAIYAGAPTGGTAGNAVLADNTAYTGTFFINQAGSSTSKFTGNLTLLGAMSLSNDITIKAGGATVGAALIKASTANNVAVLATNGSTGSMAFGAGSNGLLVLDDQNSGNVCVIVLSGASGGTLGAIISDPGSYYSTSAGAGKIGLTASGGTLTFTNQTGNALLMTCMCLKMA